MSVLTRIDLTKDVWTEIQTGVTTVSFVVCNFPVIEQGRMYRVHWGDAVPAADTLDYIPLGTGTEQVFAHGVNVETASNVYVMPVGMDGAVAVSVG